MDHYTTEIINGRTAQGCHFYGHRNLESGDLFLTLSETPPPVIRLADTGVTAKEAADGLKRLGRVWP